jgi:P-type Mg2+ transporter
LARTLLYDIGQLAIPTDRVDPEILTRPAGWDIAFVRRFMAVFGPVSSIFDFMTFYVMLVVLNAGHREFRTGWFVESLATQTLVVFAIRTRRVPFLRSRPSPAMIGLPILCATLGAILPSSPWRREPHRRRRRQRSCGLVEAQLVAGMCLQRPMAREDLRDLAGEPGRQASCS